MYCLTRISLSACVFLFVLFFFAAAVLFFRVQFWLFQYTYIGNRGSFFM